MRFLVGGYAAGMTGDAEGIGLLRAGDDDSGWASGPLSVGDTVATAPGSPSWLAWHPSLDVVYAALEGAGTVQAYRRTGDASFAPLGAPVEAGAAVCHVAVAPGGAFLVAACWGDGRVVRIGLDTAGRPSSRGVAPAAVDPYGSGGDAPATELRGALPDLAAAARALREAAGEEFAHLVPDHDRPSPAAEPAVSEGREPHAHEAIFLPGGLIATTDMGFDLVRIWRAAGDRLVPVQDVPLPKGSGPRHGLWHPSGHLYVVTELSCEAFVLRPDAEGVWSIVSGTTLSPAVLGTDQAAELAASRDRETLYAGVRGSDALAVLRVRGAGESLESIALVESGVHWPRHHTVVRDTVLVAGQLSGEVTSLPLDERTGVPGRVRHRVAVASPTMLLALR